MKIESGTYTATDSVSIYWKAWLPDDSPRAVLHIIHGYAEHIDRYANVVNELVPQAMPYSATTTGAMAGARGDGGT
jgi:alpha-beta hydrolase superfamily lysophospholipase